MIDFAPKGKKLGQYFLTDKNYIHRITDSIINSKPNHVVEIGPGKGALTAILKEEVSLDLIEIDQDWVTVWRDRGVRVFDQDAAKFDYGALSKQLSEKITVCGNLPYYATTPILFQLSKYKNCLSKVFVMVQKEVADRMIAQPDTSNYGRLSITMQYWSNIKVLFHLPPTVFYPAPKVKSTWLEITPKTVI